MSVPKPRWCLLPHPQSRCLSPPKRRPDILVDRPVQFAVRITAQRVHHDHHHFFAVLALVPFFPAFLAPPGLSLRLASMPLATARAPLLMLTFPPPLLSSCSVAVGGHLPSTSITSTSPSFGGAPICCMNSVSACPEPTPSARFPQLRGTTRACLTNQTTGRITHPRGQPRHELHHPRRETVPGQTQRHVQGMKTSPPSLSDQRVGHS